MATRKTAPLTGLVSVRKGAAAPARGSTPADATATPGERPREEPYPLTVKLAPELYFRLKRRGMRFKPRKTNQTMIVEAIEAYLGAAREP